MKKYIIVLISICCFWIIIYPNKGYTQSVTLSDSVFTAIEKSVFSRGGELFYIGIDNNALAFDYEVIKAIRDASSKNIEIIDVQMNDKKIVFNENKDEAFYYTNYNLTFKSNPFTFHVDNVRETGVLRLIDNKWEIVQQHASVPVTNDVWPAYLAKEQPVSDPLFKYSVNELKEDFDLFSLALEESHAGLYNYIGPQRFKTLTESIKKELTHPMNDLEFYRLLCPVIEDIKCGHTRISISNQTNEYLNKQNIFIPFQLKFISGKAYVLKDIQNNKIIPGSEILSINNRPISEIVSAIFKMQNSDGAITTAKYMKLNEKFHELYCLFIEQSQSFTIQYIPCKAEKPKEATVTGISNNEWWDKISSDNSPAPRLLNLKIIDNSDIAVLDIRNFVSQEINEQFGSFRHFLDSAFNDIKTKNIQNLIIDLRGNGGGNIADELIPYLVNHPVQFYKTIDTPKTRYSFLEHTDQGLFFNEINVKKWNKFRNEHGRYDLSGTRDEYLNPSPLVFNGNLYILIDGNSFSATAQIASILHDQKRATFFGEETGGSYLGSSSGDYINLTLPHTRIKVTIPIRNYILSLNSVFKTRRGVIPHYEITNSIQDIIEGNDAEMKFVIDYIPKTKSYDHNQFLLEDVKGTDLERPIVSDSIQYELRLRICNFFIPDILFQITKDFENNWDYRLGYFQYVDALKTFVFQDSIKKVIDWKQFEIRLDSFNIANIPNQNEIDLGLTKDRFFSQIIDGGSVTIEIFDNKTHKSICYYSPHSYLELLIEAGLPTKEHQDFIRFVDYLTENFDFDKLRRIQMREFDENRKKRNRIY